MSFIIIIIIIEETPLAHFRLSIIITTNNQWLQSVGDNDQTSPCFAKVSCDR